MKLPVPCIVCGFQPKSAVPENVSGGPINQPHDATTFQTTGHYGSTVWDPMTGQKLEINVCDECLKKAGKQGRVIIEDLMPAGPDLPPELHLWEHGGEYDREAHS